MKQGVGTVVAAAGAVAVLTALVLVNIPKAPETVTTTVNSGEVPLTADVATGKYSAYLCVQAKGVDDWPVQDSMNNWNTNGKNVLSFSTVDCDGTIIIQPGTYAQDAWAATTFFDKGLISIQLSPATPPEYRKHVICHELAHVMGIPHTQDQSCSNIDLTVPTPSPKEVEWVGSGLWDWRNARSVALQGGR